MRPRTWDAFSRLSNRGAVERQCVIRVPADRIAIDATAVLAIVGSLSLSFIRDPALRWTAVTPHALQPQLGSGIMVTDAATFVGRNPGAVTARIDPHLRRELLRGQPTVFPPFNSLRPLVSTHSHARHLRRARRHVSDASGRTDTTDDQLDALLPDRWQPVGPAPQLGPRQ